MSRLSGIRIWVTLLAAFTMLCAGLPAHADAPALVRIVDAIVEKGPASQLPAHLSMVLGVSTVEQKVPVKQAMLRDGATVRTFNVCAADHADLVLIEYNEQSHMTQAYRLTSSGTLRKAVTYSDGEPAVIQTGAKARAGLTRELKYWTDLQPRPSGTK